MRSYKLRRTKVKYPAWKIIIFIYVFSLGLAVLEIIKEFMGNDAYAAAFTEFYKLRLVFVIKIKTDFII